VDIYAYDLSDMNFSKAFDIKYKKDFTGTYIEGTGGLTGLMGQDDGKLISFKNSGLTFEP
jgi:hypothetical protein